jgi:hypothetical protein
VGGSNLHPTLEPEGGLKGIEISNKICDIGEGCDE